MKIANKYGLYVIEDAAEAHGASINHKKVGSFGHINCFSFYANKLITTGEGGMVTTNSKNFYQRMKYLKNLAFGKPRFVHKEIGFNYRLTGYQAAMGLSQLKKLEKNIKYKIQLAKFYQEYLDPKYISHQFVNKGFKNVYWMYGIIIKKPGLKNKIQKYLHQNGIDTRNFFYPVSLQPCFKNINLYKYKNPISLKLWNNGFYLPSSTSLKQKDIKFISNKLNSFFK